MIEQLAQKMVDVGASQAVAVCSAGLHGRRPQILADRLGVLLRTAEDVAPADVQRWLTLDGLTACDGEPAIETVSVVPILIDRTTDTLVSANDMWCATL